MIHCLARFQRTPSRCKAVRTASRLTCSGVTPCAKLTSAANSSVHTLVSLSKLRGLSCSSALSRSAWSASKARWLVCATDDPAVKASSPAWLKALMALRAVSVSQPNSAAIWEARLPLALASRIWQRRSTKASRERSPVVKPARSSWVISRT